MGARWGLGTREQGGLVGVGRVGGVGEWVGG